MKKNFIAKGEKSDIINLIFVKCSGVNPGCYFVKGFSITSEKFINLLFKVAQIIKSSNIT